MHGLLVGQALGRATGARQGVVAIIEATRWPTRYGRASTHEHVSRVITVSVLVQVPPIVLNYSHSWAMAPIRSKPALVIGVHILKVVLFVGSKAAGGGSPLAGIVSASTVTRGARLGGPIRGGSFRPVPTRVSRGAQAAISLTIVDGRGG